MIVGLPDEASVFGPEFFEGNDDGLKGKRVGH
jgi:hypothetical protein